MASKTAKTSIYIGGEDYIQVLAEDEIDIPADQHQDRRWAQSMELRGGAAIDREPTIGSVGLESIVNQQSMTISLELLWDAAFAELFREKQNNTDNVMVIVGTDSLTSYIFPATWTGIPVQNPTGSLIRAPFEVLVSGTGIDGSATSGKDRAKALPRDPNRLDGGTKKTAFFSCNAKDEVYLVVDRWEGLRLTSPLTQVEGLPCRRTSL